MYTFSPMMVANSRKHHCRVRPYTREVLVISTNLDIQKNHYPLDFTNRRGVEARIKNTCTSDFDVYNQDLIDFDVTMLNLTEREQVKTMKIQAVVQGSRPEELRRHLQLWKRF
ncbi:hypothetical protein Tco_0654564 [Tanacetum coccineum]|uniref:Uncharacterized protein n=1 Tax=Tanacetum coccineum TaxID=301880 RepID=A0ABQ4X451_9ASTR